MSALDYHFTYRRHRPSYQPPGAALLVTVRLAGSFPPDAFERWQMEGQQLEAALEAALEALPDDEARRARVAEEHWRFFERWDRALAAVRAGPFWLRNERVAALVEEAVRRRDGALYDLEAYGLMPNHVHLILRPRPRDEGGETLLADILHSFKSYTAHAANRLLRREGAFWQPDSFDHALAGPAALRRAVAHVLEDPVRAGLARRRQDWRWSYHRAG